MTRTDKRSEPDYPPERHDDDLREGTDVPRNERDKQHSSNKASLGQSHMGAEEGTMQPTKPAMQELAEMTSKHGQASAPEDDDYSPADEITPG
jgi:hypothetical protein